MYTRWGFGKLTIVKSALSKHKQRAAVLVRLVIATVASLAAGLFVAVVLNFLLIPWSLVDNPPFSRVLVGSIGASITGLLVAVLLSRWLTRNTRMVLVIGGIFFALSFMLVYEDLSTIHGPFFPSLGI
jgi:hypothetical protein